MELAVSEDRVLLTGDHELYETALSRGLETILVKADNVSKILAMLANQFDIKLEVDLDLSRCPKCNANLSVVAKDAVIDVIPDGTAIYYSHFWRCSGCGQIYWQGAHWKRIQETLEVANRLLRLF